MIRGTWVWDRRTRELVPKHLYQHDPVARSDLPAPMLISDHLDYVNNPADGKTYSSKSAYYKAVRAAGCEIVGNEKTTAAPKPQLDDPGHDIKDAIDQIAAGYVQPKRKSRGN